MLDVGLSYVAFVTFRYVPSIPALQRVWHVYRSLVRDSVSGRGPCTSSRGSSQSVLTAASAHVTTSLEVSYQSSQQGAVEKPLEVKVSGRQWLHLLVEMEARGLGNFRAK